MDCREYRNKSQEYINVAEAIKTALGYREIDRSVKKIKREKLNGSLDYKFRKFVKPDFKIILGDLIEIIEEESLVNKPNYRRILAYKNDFVNLYKGYGYEIGSWLNKEKDLTPQNNKAHLDFPLFFKESCRKCCYPDYANMSLLELDELLGEIYDLKHQQSVVPRKDRESIENEVDVELHPDSAKKNMKRERAEEYSYSSLLGWDKSGQVIRVSKCCGSGYGFDLLSIEGDGEVLVTVKASDKMEGFELTKREYDAMVKSSESYNSKYFIHKYLFEKDSSCLKNTTIYAYNKYDNTLVDIQDSENVCTIEEKITTTTAGNPKVTYICNPVKLRFSNTVSNKLKNILKRR